MRRPNEIERAHALLSQALRTPAARARFNTLQRYEILCCAKALCWAREDRNSHCFERILERVAARMENSPNGRA